MRLYRVSYKNEDHGHQGYSWFRTQREALDARKRYSGDGLTADIEPISVRMNSDGVVHALNQYAGYADNG